MSSSTMASRKARHEALTGWLFALPFTIVFIIVFVAPIIESIRAGFHKQVAEEGGLYGGGRTVEKFVGLENFQDVCTNPAFWHGIGRVMLFGVFQIPIMILAALFLALVIDSYLVRHLGFWRLSYFLPYAIPGLVAAIMWTYLYVPEISPFAGHLSFSLLSSHVILASMANMTTWTFTGYNMLIFLAALQAIPSDLYEAARIDGASG